MNGFNRHNKYRKKARRRARIGILLIVSAIVLVVIIVAFFVIGNIINDQSDKRNESNKEPNITDTEDTEKKEESAPIIRGYSVLLETTDSSRFYNRLDNIISKGYSSASIPLNTKDGILLYNSSVSDELGYISSSRVTPKSAVDTAKNKNVYLSGVYYVSAFSESNALLRSVELSRAAAILSEVLIAGFDEVVIVAPELTAEHTQEIIKFTNDIRILAENGKIGITLSDSILESENASETISELNKNVDFLCLDASEHGDADPSEYIDGRVSADNLLYLHMYKMRILLPNTADDSRLDEYIKITEKYGLNNWQFI